MRMDFAASMNNLRTKSGEGHEGNSWWNGHVTQTRRGFRVHELGAVTRVLLSDATALRRSTSYMLLLYSAHPLLASHIIS